MRWDLNPGAAALRTEEHTVLEERRGDERREDHLLLGCFLLPRGLGSRRDFAGKERGKSVVTRTRAENQMETCGVHLDGALFFTCAGANSQGAD